MSSCKCCGTPCEDCLCIDSNKTLHSNLIFSIYKNSQDITTDRTIRERGQIRYYIGNASFNDNTDNEDKAYFCVLTECGAELGSFMTDPSSTFTAPFHETSEKFNICFNAFRDSSSILTENDDTEIKYPHYESPLKIIPCFFGGYTFTGVSTVPTQMYLSNTDIISSVGLKPQQYILELSSDINDWYSLNSTGQVDYNEHPTKLSGFFGVCVVFEGKPDIKKLVEEIAISDICLRLLGKCDDCDYAYENLEQASYTEDFGSDIAFAPSPSPLVSIQHLSGDPDVGNYSRLTFDISNPSNLGTIIDGTYYFNSYHYFTFPDGHLPLVDGQVANIVFCLQGKWVQNPNNIVVHFFIEQTNPAGEVIRYKIIYPSNQGNGGKLIFDSSEKWSNETLATNDTIAYYDSNGNADLSFGPEFKVGIFFGMTCSSYFNNKTDEEKQVIIDIANFCCKKTLFTSSDGELCNPEYIVWGSGIKVPLTKHVELTTMDDASLDYVYVGSPDIQLESKEIITASGNSIRQITQLTYASVSGMVQAIHFFKNYQNEFNYQLCRWENLRYGICLTYPSANPSYYGGSNIAQTIWFRQNGNLYYGGNGTCVTYQYCTDINYGLATSAVKVLPDGTLTNEYMDFSYGAAPFEVGFGIGTNIASLTAGGRDYYAPYFFNFGSIGYGFEFDNAVLFQQYGNNTKYPYTPVYTPPNYCQQPHCFGIEYFELEVLRDLGCGIINHTGQPQIPNMPRAGTTIIIPNNGPTRIGNLVWTARVLSYFPNVYDTGTIKLICLASCYWFDNTANFSRIDFIIDKLVYGFTSAGDVYYHTVQDGNDCEDWTKVMQMATFKGAIGQAVEVICTNIITNTGTKTKLVSPGAKIRPIFRTSPGP